MTVRVSQSLWILLFALVVGMLVPAELRAAADLDEGVEELAREIQRQIARLGRKAVAVVDFSDLEGRITLLGRFVADELSARLVRGGEVRVVDRQHLGRVIEEQKLAIYGVTSPAAVRRLGQLVGADVLVVGTVTDLGEQVRVTAKVLSTRSGEIVGSAQTTVPKDDTVRRLLSGAPPRAGAAGGPPERGGARPGATSLESLPVVQCRPYCHTDRFRWTRESFTVAGRIFDRGLLILADSEVPGGRAVVYDLRQGYDYFTAVIGVEGERVDRSVWVVFRVYVDGDLRFESRPMRPGDSPVSIRVPVKGGRALKLENQSNASWGIWAAWAEAQVVKE